MTSDTTFSEADIDAIARKVNEKLSEAFPRIMLQLIRDELPAILSDSVPTLASKLDEYQRLSSMAESDANDYIKSNSKFFNKHYRIRKKKFEQFTRCKCLLELYENCLQEKPAPYILKKFKV